MTSAFGNTALPSLRRMPLMWSPWKWLMMIVSTCAGSKPAALKFAIQVPDVGAPELPLPVSMSTSLPPVLSTVVVNGIGVTSVGRKACSCAFFTSSSAAFFTKPSARGRIQKPSLMAVASMSPIL